MKKLETLGFKHFCMSVGNLPSSYVESLSYYECLLWLIKYLQEEVIPTVNNNSEVVEELQGLYLELKSYVDNYFDNLDVQEEINNKLDKMVEDGTLQEIISSYLNSKAVFGFDTVADMKQASNLINGSYARTLGYYSKNDGGSATYKIRTKTNDDVVDEGSIIALNNSTLIAELIIDNNLNIKQFGAYGDGIHDDTIAIQNSIDKVNKAIIPEGTFIVSTLNLHQQTLIKGFDKNKCILKSKNTEYTDDTAMLYGDFTGSNGMDKVIIEDVCLDGDHHGATGIKIFKDNTNYTHSGMNTLKNLMIKFFNRNGIYLGRGASETIVNKIDIYNCGKNGIVIETTDLVLNEVDSHNNEENGFYINGGYNRFANCKAWWNGRNNNAEQSDRKYGFYVKLYSNNFVNCVAQENANHGIYVESAKGITFNSCSVDRNGLPLTNWSGDSPETPYASGIYIKDSSQIVYDGVCWDMLKWQSGQTQKYGINMDNSNSIYVNAIINDQEIDYTYSGGYFISLIINGRKVLTNMEQTIGAYDLLNNTTIKNYIQPAGEQSRLGYDVFSENSQFQLYSNNDDKLRIATYVKNQNNGWDWTATPVNISNTGDLQLGKSDKKMGFYGAIPITKPLADGVATDLATTMALVNKIASALGYLGLIQR